MENILTVLPDITGLDCNACNTIRVYLLAILYFIVNVIGNKMSKTMVLCNLLLPQQMNLPKRLFEVDLYSPIRLLAETWD